MLQNYDIDIHLFVKCWYIAAEHTWDDFFCSLSVRYIQNGDGNDIYNVNNWNESCLNYFYRGKDTVVFIYGIVSLSYPLIYIFLFNGSL